MRRGRLAKHLTDGLANQGITDATELASHARSLRTRGVSTSTFGVGEDVDEALLQGLADAGGGHFSFIERPEQITDLIASEVGELLEVVARDAAIELTSPEGLTVRSVSPFPVETRGRRIAILLGDLVAGQRPRSSSGSASATGQSARKSVCSSGSPRGDICCLAVAG